MLTLLVSSVHEGSHPGWILTWSPGIGDPNWIGWVTTFAYLGAAGLCVNAFRSVARGVRVWLVIAIAMLLLGLNKQLDLQTLFNVIGKWMALREGWYGQRLQVQAAFVTVMIVLFGVSVMVICFLGRRLHTQLQVSLAGMVLLMAFVILRAASIEHFNKLPALGKNSKAAMELGGIALVCGGAWRCHRRKV